MPVPTVDEALEIAERLAPRLKALGDPHRLAIVLLLADRPMAVRELQEALGLRQTLVSHHLGALRRAGVVSATAEGRSNIYALCCDEIGDPVRTVAALVRDGLRGPVA